VCYQQAEVGKIRSSTGDGISAGVEKMDLESKRVEAESRQKEPELEQTRIDAQTENRRMEIQAETRTRELQNEREKREHELRMAEVGRPAEGDERGGYDDQNEYEDGDERGRPQIEPRCPRVETLADRAKRYWSALKQVVSPMSSDATEIPQFSKVWRRCSDHLRSRPICVQN